MRSNIGTVFIMAAPWQFSEMYLLQMKRGFYLYSKLMLHTRIAPTILEHTRIVGTILPLEVYQNCSFQQFWYVPELDNSGAYQNWGRKVQHDLLSIFNT